MKRLFSALLVAGLLTACAGVAAPGATKSGTPQQNLAASGKAMGQLRSAKFDVNGTVHVTLPQALVDQLRAKGGAQAGLLSSDMTVILKISGAAQKPDQFDATISAKLGGLTLNTEVISTGGKLYYKDPMTSKWEVLKASAPTAEPKTGSGKLSYQTVIDTATSVTEVTDASSKINGVTVEHYRVVPDLVKLFAALSAGHSTNSAVMSALQTVLQNATVSADVWTGTSDHLVRRASYDADVTADLSQLAAAFKTGSATAKSPALSLPAGSMAHVSAHVVVDLHDFNSQVKIQAPKVG